MLRGTDLDRLRFGSVMEAYGTGVFGVGVTRSEEGQRRVDELAGLNVASLDRPLSPDEATRRDALSW